MKKIFGNTDGLKPNQINRLESLYRRRIAPQTIIGPDLCRALCRLSVEIHRQIGLLITRQGKISHVICGDMQGIIIPDLSDWRMAPGRLRGVRCIHTRPGGDDSHAGGLTDDDYTDLALLRLDLMAVVTMDRNGEPGRIHIAHILPTGHGANPTQTLDPCSIHQLRISCLDLISALESELQRRIRPEHADEIREKALLVSVTTSAQRQQAQESLSELEELARSAGIEAIDVVLQLRRRIDPRLLIGSGKLNSLAINCLQHGAHMVIFDQELSPSQIRSISDRIDLKVIDRTQLILDIFAQRAQSREGKLQVELAQLKYMLPRLITKNTAMSRLTGGIGGRGPGETKLEINRRRVRDRIRRLEKQLKSVRKNRRQQKARRDRKQVPIVSIVGYTNAGKSTLLNTLTQSRVHAENRLFATLDPTSRRIRFPHDQEVILTDTVGFIRQLPTELIAAFRATLEELETADVLLHVIDVANPQFAQQMEAVDTILTQLRLTDIPIIRVLNKKDRISDNAANLHCQRLEAVAISALDRRSLIPLIEKIQRQLPNRQMHSNENGGAAIRQDSFD